MKIFTRACILFPTIFLLGCIAQQQQERMSGVLNRHIGSSIANFVAERGYPSSQVKLSDRETAFRWIFTKQGAGAVLPMGGSLIVVPPSQLTCVVTFTAASNLKKPELKDWIISNYNWQGAC
jgi:hypothetical protein